VWKISRSDACLGETQRREIHCSLRRGKKRVVMYISSAIEEKRMKGLSIVVESKICKGSESC
jgi:hypothetical protein